MPLTIRKAYTDGKPVTSQIVHFSSLFQTSPSSTAELIQWGTLIIFDNLIGHTDRYNAYMCVLFSLFIQFIYFILLFIHLVMQVCQPFDI